MDCRVNCALYVVIYRAILDFVEMRILTLQETASSRGGLIVEESAVRWRSTAEEKRHQNLAELIVEETLITQRLATLYVWVN